MLLDIIYTMFTRKKIPPAEVKIQIDKENISWHKI